MRISDWSSDVCSSDLSPGPAAPACADAVVAACWSLRDGSVLPDPHPRLATSTSEAKPASPAAAFHCFMMSPCTAPCRPGRDHTRGPPGPPRFLEQAHAPVPRLGRRRMAWPRYARRGENRGTPYAPLHGPACGHLSAVHCRPRSEEHTSELQSLMRISYAVFCLKKKTK